MKKIFAITLAVIVAAMLCVIPALAEEGFQLIPHDATWNINAHGGYECTVEFDGDVAVFTGGASGSWPATYTYYEPQDCFIADVDKYTLHYDFSLTTGNTNILLMFSSDPEAPGNELEYSLSNTSLGDVFYDSGSGDLASGEYAGYIALSDFIKSKTFLNSVPFDTTLVSENNELCFSGIKVYSVNGAVITVNALEIIPNEAVPVIEESSEVEESSEPEAESSAEVSKEESKETSAPAESSAAPAESSAAVESQASAEASTPADNGDSDSFPWVWVIAGVLAVAVIVIVIVIVKKKK